MYIHRGRGRQSFVDKILMLMSTETPYRFAHLLQVLKQSLKYGIKHILNDFIHVCSPRAGTDNPIRKSL